MLFSRVAARGVRLLVLLGPFYHKAKIGLFGPIDEPLLPRFTAGNIWPRFAARRVELPAPAQWIGQEGVLRNQPTGIRSASPSASKRTVEWYALRRSADSGERRFRRFRRSAEKSSVNQPLGIDTKNDAFRRS